MRFSEWTGVEPARIKGYLQPVAFEQQLVDQDKSSADFVRAGGDTIPIRAGDEMLVTAGMGPRPQSVDAPLVFIGYGLHLPKQGHDDFAGQDFKGKIVVVLSERPADLSGALKSNARSERNTELGVRFCPLRSDRGTKTLATSHHASLSVILSLAKSALSQGT